MCHKDRSCPNILPSVALPSNHGACLGVLHTGGGVSKPGCGGGGGGGDHVLPHREGPQDGQE